MSTRPAAVLTEPVAESASHLMQMITGYWVSQAIYVIAKLGIADVLKGGPKSIADLCEVCPVNEDYLYRIMRALASVKILDEMGDKTFQLTPLSDLLRTDHPNSMRAISIMTGEEHYVAWGRLKDSVLSGDSPFESVYGMNVFEYFEKNPLSAQTFNEAMIAVARNEQAAIVPAYDFSRLKTIVDVGGGTGGLVAKILKHNPNIEAILFDLPHVVETATAFLHWENVLERCRIREGNFFENVPEGGDAYLLSHIIHDWNDEKAIKILKNVYNAMPEQGVLLLVECVVEPGSLEPRAQFMDLNMLVMTPGGRERTVSEFQKLLEQAGFAITRILPTEAVTSIIEAVKVV